MSESNFRKRLEEVINSESMENESNTPDFILADFMAKSLEAFDHAVLQRERWYGHHHCIGGSTPATEYADGTPVPPGTYDDDEPCDDPEGPDAPPPAGAV